MPTRRRSFFWSRPGLRSQIVDPNFAKSGRGAVPRVRNVSKELFCRTRKQCSSSHSHLNQAKVKFHRV